LTWGSRRLDVLGVDIDRVHELHERQAEVVAVTVNDIELRGLGVGVAHVHVLGELPVPQLLVGLVALLEVEP
jgi:hypothetical protein